MSLSQALNQFAQNLGRYPSGIDSAKKLNDGDKAVLKIVDVIRPPS